MLQVIYKRLIPCGFLIDKILIKNLMAIRFQLMQVFKNQFYKGNILVYIHWEVEISYGAPLPYPAPDFAVGF